MKARGYTLIELMTTVGIAAVLGTMSVMGVTQLQKVSRAGNATQQVLALLNQGRQRALSVGAPVRFYSVAATSTKAVQVGYERLGCTATLAGSCPRVGCSPDVTGSVCTGSCANTDGTCAEKTPLVQLPPGMTLAFMTGATVHNSLCLIAGSAQPSFDCLTPAANGRIVLTGSPGALPRVLYVEGLTGLPRATDCQVTPTSTDCP